MLAAANTRFLLSRSRSSMGSATRSSTRTKATRNTTVSASGTMVLRAPPTPQRREGQGDEQGDQGRSQQPGSRPVDRRPSAGDRVRRSRRSRRRSSVQPARIVAAAMGTLMKKIHRQLAWLTMSAPDDRTQGEAHVDRGDVEPQSAAPLRRREGRGDDPRRGREHERASGALDAAPEDHHGAARREPGHYRARPRRWRCPAGCSRPGPASRPACPPG